MIDNGLHDELDLRSVVPTRWVPRPLRTLQRAGTTIACAKGFSCRATRVVLTASRPRPGRPRVRARGRPLRFSGQPSDRQVAILDDIRVQHSHRGCPILAFFARVGGDTACAICLLCGGAINPPDGALPAPALRKEREGRGTHFSCDASEVKSPGHPPHRAETGDRAGLLFLVL